MKIEKFKDIVMQVATQMPGGFTFDPRTNTFPSRGYVVAARDTQDCFGRSGLFRVLKFYLRHLDYCVGGWRNEHGVLQFDASKVYDDLDTAIAAAVANKQRAIYNLYTGKEIMACDYGVYANTLVAA